MTLARGCLALSFLPFIGNTASAQLSVIEALTKNVTDIGVYTHFGWPKRHAEVGASRGYWTGFGLELSYGIHTTTRYRDPVIRQAVKDFDAQMKRYRALGLARSRDSVTAAVAALKKALDDNTDVTKIEIPAPPRRTRRTPVEEEIERQLRDTTIATTVSTRSVVAILDVPPETEPVWVVEFGLGYTQMQTFREAIDPAAAGLDSGEVRGGIREFPSVSLYASCRICFNLIPVIGTHWKVRPYFGLRGGLTQLSNLRAFVPYPSVTGNPATLPPGMLVLKGEGSTFQGAAITGLSFSVGKIAMFAEGSHTWRTIPSVDWSGTPANVVFPRDIPRALDLSAWSLAIGTQVPVAR
ncbi:MAG TPA: hypothetical protein VEB19_10930 [Gemmatimonadaceae bacterium]|nr:hypothetical protein [Gemmatimonadaceae bacterium]